MGSRASAAAALAALCACATARPAVGGGDAVGVPLLNAPKSWDEAFTQLVDRCPDPVQAPALSSDAIFAAVYVLASLGVGGWVIAHRSLDTTTAIAGGIGVVAGAGELYSLWGYVQSRNEAKRAYQRQLQQWRDDWATGDRAQRDALLDSVAGACGEQTELAADRAALGPPH
jgi:hypothetical protein